MLKYLLKRGHMTKGIITIENSLSTHQGNSPSAFSSKKLQGRTVELGFSPQYVWKIVQISSVILGAAALVYFSVCDTNEHRFCVPKGLTDIALNLDKVASIF
jgi:hypothetical protein